MPQIVVFLSPTAANMILPSEFEKLGSMLTKAVETAFGIDGKDDVAFDIVGLLYTKGESPVQIEVRYTAGGDEYGAGQAFDPSYSEKEEADRNIRKQFAEFLTMTRTAMISPSVWILPQYNGKFSPGQRE